MISPPRSNDNDSTSSEYTAENSAPTELLAEFLTSIMRKDYVNALKYCKLSNLYDNVQILVGLFELLILSCVVLDFEPNNKTAKDFYPELVQKVNERQQSSSSDQSDENCNFTSSLELVDNEILDNDMIDENYSDSSSISSNSTTSNGSLDLNSYSEDDAPQPDQEDLINQQLSYSSNNSSRSDPFPPSMSSSESINHRFGGNYSPSFSFTSLLLEESDDFNNNEQSPTQQQVQPHSSVAASVVDKNAASSSPFTSKLVNMIKRKLN